MEFFAIANVKTTAEVLQALTVRTLDRYCADIDKILLVESDNSAKVYCTWGEFTVNREVINGGVRFTLPTCPNALSWTITTGYEPAADSVVIHGTINRTEHEADFIESIESFIHAWKTGLELHLEKNAMENK